MTVRSVIDIDVNDAAFKAFEARFAKYQGALKKMPGAWGEAEKATESVADNFQIMTAALLAQNELLRKADTFHKGGVSATRSMARNTTEVAGNIASATKSLLKWGAIGFGAVGAAIWGLDALANRVGNQRRSAQGLGVTTGQQAALNINYGKYFDVNSNLENIANAKSSLSQSWLFSAMGIDPNGKNPAELAVELAMKASSLYKSGITTAQGMGAFGLDNIYSMDEYRTLGGMSPKELADSERAYRSDAAPGSSLSRSDETNKKWQNFGIAMTHATQAIENTFVRRLEPLEPSLQKFAVSIEGIVDKFMSNPNLGKQIEDAGKGLEQFAEYVGTPEFLMKVKSFSDDVGALAAKIHDALVFMNFIPNSRPGPLTPTKDNPGSIKGVAAIAKSTAYARNWYEAHGLDENSAAAIGANFYYEGGIDKNGSLNPFSRERGGGPGYGLGQWGLARQKDYLAKYGHTMQSVTSWPQAMEEQMQFSMSEMTSGDYQGVMRRLKDSKLSAADKAWFVSREYEKPSDFFGLNATKRANTAAAIVLTIHNAPGNSATVTTAALAQ